MSTLTIINNFLLDSDGVETIGKQGVTTDAITDGYSLATSGLTITGTSKLLKGQLATATVNLLYDASVDFPATFDYLFLWTDQTCYIQVIGSATNATLKIAAQVPYTLSGFGSILAAANGTPISGGSEPAVSAVSKVYLGNYSGNLLNYLFAVVT